MTDSPEAQRALRAELLTIVGDGRPLTYTDVMSDELPYLEAVTNEVLRCAHIAEGMRRTGKLGTQVRCHPIDNRDLISVVAPINVLGCQLPIGTDIILFTQPADHFQTVENESQIRARDDVRSDSSLKSGTSGRAYWKDVDEFYPERWLTVDPATGRKVFNRKAGYLTPFGLGLRSCAGKQLAVSPFPYDLSSLMTGFSS